MFLISVDAHSKWPEVVEMSNTSAQKTIDELRKLFAVYGLPEQIVTDNGPQFTANEFIHFLKENSVKHIRCFPYHPSSNDAAKRFVRTFKQAMKSGHSDGRSLQHRLDNFLLTYKITSHATTNEAPSILFQGRSLRTRLDLIIPNLQKTVSDKQADQKSNHDRHSLPRDLETPPEPTSASAPQAEPSVTSDSSDSSTSDSHTRRYPLRNRRSPDCYCDTHMHTRKREEMW